MTYPLPGFELSRNQSIEFAQSIPLTTKIKKALELLKCHEPDSGYVLCFSGGKDSVVIKKLAEIAGVKFQAQYNLTTIDPPELVRFIQQTPDVKWNRPEKNLIFKMLDKTCGPPTRKSRWCCEIYKERNTNGVKILGVRADESPKRAANWNTVNLKHSELDSILPVLYWTDKDIWEFIKIENVPYCSLYDEGFTRLGCIGCPMGGRTNMLREFKRWPRFKNLWQIGFQKFWEKYQGTKNRFGEPRWFNKFKSWQELWNWWICENTEAETCQGRLF